MNCHTAEVFNPKTMLEAVMAMDKRKISVTNRIICRDKNTATLYNRDEVKKWAVVYTKHVLLDGDDKYCTLPFGYFEADASEM